MRRVRWLIGDAADIRHGDALARTFGSHAQQADRGGEDGTVALGHRDIR